MAQIRIGISGWTYPPWRGSFYPEGLRQKDELRYAAAKFRSIEVNGTFYALQRPSSYQAWFEQTPKDFVFSVKAPRFITHMKRLKGVDAPLANFFASGVLRLGEKLGPILWQLPPSSLFDESRLEAFMSTLPRSFRRAAQIARRHDTRIEKTWSAVKQDWPLRHAFEVRHPSFKNPRFIALLRKHGCALVVADTAGKWPNLEDITADFVYVRLHGDAELYVSGYTPRSLKSWSKKVMMWTQGKNVRGARLAEAKVSPSVGARDVYVYFDNDVKTRAPYDAMNLAHLLGLGAKPPRPPALRTEADVPRQRWPDVSRTRS